jgi:hypothetical protein
MRSRYQGRRTARYSENADVHGRVKERRFDLNPNPGPVRLSEHELGQAEYAALPAGQRDQLLSFLASHIKPDTARIGDQRGGLTGCLWSDELAGDAAAFLGFPVHIRAMNGALLAAGYLPTRKTSRSAVWAVGAARKDA